MVAGTSSRSVWSQVAIPAAIAIAVGVVYAWFTVPHGQASTPTPVTVSTDSPPLVQATVPNQAPPPGSPLPALDLSDAPMRDALVGLVGPLNFSQLFVPSNIIRTWVSMVDALPRHHLAPGPRPLVPPDGAFISTSDDQASVMPDVNFPRYAKYVAMTNKLDPLMLAKTYVHFRPLFQSAYQELTHSTGSFDARLMECIENLLATPVPSGPVLIHRPNSQFEYVDESLEGLSVGQKLLLRMGPDQAAAVKGRLKAFRQALTAESH